MSCTSVAERLPADLIRALAVWLPLRTRLRVMLVCQRWAAALSSSPVPWARLDCTYAELRPRCKVLCARGLLWFVRHELATLSELESYGHVDLLPLATMASKCGLRVPKEATKVNQWTFRLAFHHVSWVCPPRVGPDAPFDACAATLRYGYKTLRRGLLSPATVDALPAALFSQPHLHDALRASLVSVSEIESASHGVLLHCFSSPWGPQAIRDGLFSFADLCALPSARHVRSVCCGPGVALLRGGHATLSQLAAVKILQLQWLTMSDVTLHCIAASAEWRRANGNNVDADDDGATVATLAAVPAAQLAVLLAHDSPVPALLARGVPLSHMAGMSGAQMRLLLRDMTAPVPAAANGRVGFCVLL